MQTAPRVIGIVNITADSFSDGGKYLTSSAAVEQANKLLAEGAQILDIGPAASNPDAIAVSPEQEIRRLDPVLTALLEKGAEISVDSFQPETQRYAISRGVGFLNDIQGFPEPSMYPAIAGAGCKLIVMHSVQGRGRATRVEVSADEVWDRILRFFEQRISALVSGGIARDRLILDPGMGFFLGSKLEASMKVLANLGELKRAFNLPLHICVSRKSFLRTLTGKPISEIGPASLSAEIYAVMQGVDYVRTHDPGALCDGLRVISAIKTQAGESNSEA